MKKVKLNFKVAIALVGAIIIIGTLLWVFVGGFGTDFTGGSGLRVVYSDSITKTEYKKLNEDLSDALTNVGLKANRSVQLSHLGEIVGVEFSFPSTIKGKEFDEAGFNALQVLMIKGEAELSADQKQTLTALLGSDFNFANAKTASGVAKSLIVNRDPGVDLDTLAFFVKDVDFYQYTVSDAGVNLVLWCGLCAGVGLVAAAAYCGLRFIKFGADGRRLLNGIRSALTVIINGLFAFVLAFMLSVVFAVAFAVPLQASFAGALLISVFYSVVTAAYMLNEMRKLDNKGENVAGVVGKTFAAIGIFTAVGFVSMLILGLFGTAFTAAFASAVAAGLISAAFCSLFILPPVWNALKFSYGAAERKQKNAQGNE